MVKALLATRICYLGGTESTEKSNFTLAFKQYLKNATHSYAKKEIYLTSNLPRRGIKK